MAEEQAPQQMTPEQQQALQEKLKNMSPEELKEFQKQQCIFCQITSGKVQSKKVYEDERVLAVLDINPANPGHILLMPKEHYQIMPLIPEEELAHVFSIAKHLSQQCLKAFKCQGTNIFVANGIVAGQKAQHFMIHIIPRMENDTLQNLNIPAGKVDKKAQSEAFVKLKKRVNEIFNLHDEVIDDRVDEPEEEPKEEKKPPKAKKVAKPRKNRRGLEVDADFEEDIDKKEEPKEEPKEESKEKPKDDKVDLDSIAGLFG
jgi:histidine triad (HIT) family protein|tara:strand:- start:189 stop:965 length:777 start_codon:yes stop_codon:yes gene_type:complete